MLTDSTHDEEIRIGNFCHSKGIRFIVAETRGLFGKLFCDFGERFVVYDTNGEQEQSVMLSAITVNVSQSIVCNSY